MAVTLRDIAKHLNLSHATVSFVLNDRRDVAIPEPTRERVIQAAKELGYRPNRAARALVSGRTQMVALCLPEFGHPYYERVFKTLFDICRESGYEVLVSETMAGHSRRAIDWPVDGILVVDGYDVIKRGDFPDHTPVISIGTYVDRSIDNVRVDLMGGAIQATNHLFDQGCRRIVYVGDVPFPDFSDERETAYENVLRLADLSPERVTPLRPDAEEVRRTVREYVRGRGRPDAFFCSSDHVAFATIRALADLGYRVPQDCAVVGYDGIEAGELSVPSLTTVVQPVQAMCRRALEFLLNRLRDPSAPPQSSTMTATLIVRESSRIRYPLPVDSPR